MLTSTTLGIVILLLGQILFWASIVYTSLLVLRYRKITEWYNRKAGKEIVSHFRFRSLAPLVLTAFFGLIALCVGLTSATGDNVSNEQVSYNMLWAGILALVYPVSWLVWRLVRAGRSENPRAERWRLIHDASLNIAIGFGGGIVLIIGVGLTVLASFTKWDHFFPEKWREIAGVDVVPESKTHYLVAAGLSVVAIITQFIPNGENIVTTIIGLVALAVVGIGWASLVSLPFAIMSERVDQIKMGLYMGIFNLSVVLPQLVASFKMGEVVSAAQDKSVIFLICALCLAISGLLWLFVKNDKK